MKHAYLSLILVGGLLTAPDAWAQAPSNPGSQAEAAEAAQLERGRALLSQGDTAGASALARTLSMARPNSPAVLLFAVEADLVRAGATAALATYERWATTNQTDDPPAMHLIARAMLKEAVPSTPGASQKIAILRALAAEGDADAAAALSSESLQREVPAGLLASTGSERAVSALLGQLQSPMTPERRRAIASLGESRSRRAVTPLMDLLSDPNQDIRMAAAEALGKLGAIQAVGPLKALLSDPVFPVHYAAASALLALNDPSGLPWLRQLATSQEPGIRLAAAQAMRSQPDNVWLGLVRDLTQAAEPDIRRQAAELLAPHDAQAAKATLAPMLTDENVAQREVALTAYLRDAETDLAVLRKYLRDAKADTRLQAALRILQLTQ
jgi:HEAT repeat protein